MSDTHTLQPNQLNATVPHPQRPITKVFLSLCAQISLLFCTQIGVLISTQAPASAAVSGAGFTAEEIERHRQLSPQLAQLSAQCINSVWSTHVEFQRRYGFAKYYGNRHYGKNYHRVDVRKATLRQNFPNLSQRAIDEGAPQMESTACITMTLRCLEQAFQQTGQTTTWQKLEAWVGRKDPRTGSVNWFGHELQLALIDLGWRSLYWNPDPSQNAQWDAEENEIWKRTVPEKPHDPKRGQHVATYNSVMRRSRYYTVPVDDRQTLVGFGTRPPASFKATPFFVAIAHLGYHVFPGSFGRVVEAHSTRRLGAFDNIEMGEFNPLLGQRHGYAPRWTNVELYRSGLLVVPPGY
ncbi:MAG TPA: hypothetical protein PLZ57_06150 [Pseudobdellovibrionaceae bacterium]|nr:hypothetical protein [Pseudobdellovibrionaceae bacterium]